MFARIENWKLIDTVTQKYQYNFDAHDWVLDSRNIGLINDLGDITLFQYLEDGKYFGHFFYQSRGKQAIETAEEVLKEVFKNYPVEVIIGLTPITHLGARWLSKRIGFKEHGIINGLSGKEVLFIMTKSEYQEVN